MNTSSSPERARSPERVFDYGEALGSPGMAVGSEDRYKQALARAQAEGETRGRARFEQELASCRARVQEALAGFGSERDRYFRKVEGEVVQLALAIARKILRREAQVDKLLLAGMVRVALDNLHASTRVGVRVHPQSAGGWREYFERTMKLEQVPEVIEDATLDPGRCVLETSVGTTEIGIEPQLKEIEQGLLDLLAQNPAAADHA